MGYRYSLVALRGMGADVLLEACGFERTGNRSDISETGFSLVEAIDDWTLVIADGGAQMSTFDEDAAKRLSSEHEALYFFCESSSMTTELTAFQERHYRWAIRYDGSDGVSTPSVDGAAPDFVEHLVRERREDQDAEDKADGPSADCMYEVTSDALMRLVGVRVDQDSDLDHPEPFEELRRVRRKRGGALARLFGKRHV